MQVAHVVGGLVTARARRVVVVFANGDKLRLKAQRPPRAFRRALGTSLRVFAGDAMAIPVARQSRIVAFDARGRRVARSRTARAGPGA